MKKIFVVLAISLTLFSVSGGVVEAKRCVGYCPGEPSNSGSGQLRNTYVAPYFKSNGKLVDGYTRSKPCYGYYCP